MTPIFEKSGATRIPLADKSVDLVCGSPPYCDCRTYGIDAKYRPGDWIDFMHLCTKEALRVSRGLVVWIVAGPTHGGQYWPACEGLMYTLWLNGIQQWRPAIWHKTDEKGGGTGIPGSGGKQGLRGDWEYCIVAKNPGPLPWADPCFEKRAPKCKPGGRMRNRQPSGHRELQAFDNPKYVNPGNVIRARVGGGHMGDRICSENEAPFPEKLAAFWIQAYCPPGGTVLDPFSGSGTTAVEACRLGRQGIGYDLRESQVELGRRRWAMRVEQGRAT